MTRKSSSMRRAEVFGDVNIGLLGTTREVAALVPRLHSADAGGL
jgi:hypothetical protein